MRRTDPDRYRVAVCMATPFAEGGRFDERLIASLVDPIASQGLGLAIGTASPGEGASLSLDETERFFDTVKRTVAGRAPSCAMGFEPRSAAQLEPILRAAERAKLDSVQLYTLDPGHAMKPTETELERYFATLLDGLAIPAAISTHHYNGLVPLTVLERLLERFPNIRTIHCTSEVNYLHQLVDLVDGRTEILVGGPMQALSTLAIGGQGFLCSEGTIAPVVVGELQAAVRSGDFAAAMEAYRRVIGIFALNVWPGGTVRFLKTAMKILDIPGWHTRPPFERLDARAEQSAAAAMRKLDLPEWRGRLG